MRSLTEETRNYRQEFKAYYYEKMVNELARFEELRKPELFKYWFCLSLIVVAAVVTIFFLNYFSKLMPVGFWEKNGASEPIMMLGFFSAAGFCWLANKVKKDFERKVKAGVINSFLSFFGDFTWSCNDCVSHSEIEDSKVVGNFTSMTNDDYFEGRYKNLRIVISEVKLVRGSGKNRTQIFSGIFVKLDLNKRFNSHTIIVENNPLKGFFAKNFNVDMQKIELEDVEFEKEFDVYAHDQVEARYLITPSFIERFKALKKVYDSKDIRASFLDKSITISIPCQKDMFCLADVRKPVTDTGEIQQLFEEFAAVLALVDLLNLE